ncbi:ABC transporter substrate-binding protein [Christensenellaceae bacterium OttesenSCG-928-M15]|nr:ABC transporter substrate-binding protein [Christensenellaceae bacterium OttesenSCG-928-M15]
MKKYGLLALLILCICVVPAGVSCDAAMPAQTNAPAFGNTTALADTLIIALNEEPTHLNGVQGGIDPNGKINPQIYDKLVKQNPATGEISPALAERWEMLDETTWLFHLRDDVYFHNGDNLIAEDVLFSCRQNDGPGGLSWIWGGIDTKNSYVESRYTVAIKTYDTYPGLLAMLASEAYIVNKSLYQEMGADAYDRNPVGTGPYAFVEWVAGESITLQKNERYWGGAGHFKTMIFRFIADDDARALALEKGEVDIAVELSAQQALFLETSGWIDTIIHPALTTDYIGFHCQKAPFRDKKVRQALRHALNMEAIVDKAFHTGYTGEVADGICPPSFVDYLSAKGSLSYEYDIKKARQLMKEAGYPNGFSCRLLSTNRHSRVALAAMVKEAWAKLGVEVELYVVKMAHFLQIIQSGDYDAYVGGWVLSTNDGDLMHDTFYSDERLWYDANLTAYANVEYDRTVDAARKEPDRKIRATLYGRAQDIIREDLPVIPCAWGNKVIGMRNTLTGYDEDPSGYPCFAGIRPKTDE